MKEGAHDHVPSSVQSDAPCNREQKQAAGPWGLQSEGLILATWLWSCSWSTKSNLSKQICTTSLSIKLLCNIWGNSRWYRCDPWNYKWMYPLTFHVETKFSYQFWSLRPTANQKALSSLSVQPDWAPRKQITQGLVSISDLWDDESIFIFAPQHKTLSTTNFFSWVMR